MEVENLLAEQLLVRDHDIADELGRFERRPVHGCDEQERREEQVEAKTIVHRKITGIKKLYDVSAVSFPANPNTDISARSKDLIDGEIKRFEAERLHAQEIKELRSRILEHLDHKEV